MRLKLFALASLTVFTASVQAALSPNIVVTAIKDMTKISNETNTVFAQAKKGNVSKAAKKGLGLLTTIVESANKDIKIIINAGDPGFSKYSQQDICKAYADFVKVHENMLETIIGKREPLSGTPLSAPTGVILRAVKEVVDKLSFGIFKTVPTCKEEAERGRKELDDTLRRAIKAYEFDPKKIVKNLGNPFGESDGDIFGLSSSEDDDGYSSTPMRESKPTTASMPYGEDEAVSTTTSKPVTTTSTTTTTTTKAIKTTRSTPKPTSTSSCEDGETRDGGTGACTKTSSAKKTRTSTKKPLTSSVPTSDADYDRKPTQSSSCEDGQEVDSDTGVCIKPSRTKKPLTSSMPTSDADYDSKPTQSSSCEDGEDVDSDTGACIKPSRTKKTRTSTKKPLTSSIPTSDADYDRKPTQSSSCEDGEEVDGDTGACIKPSRTKKTRKSTRKPLTSAMLVTQTGFDREPTGTGDGEPSASREATTTRRARPSNPYSGTPTRTRSDYNTQSTGGSMPSRSRPGGSKSTRPSGTKTAGQPSGTPGNGRGTTFLGPSGTTYIVEPSTSFIVRTITSYVTTTSFVVRPSTTYVVHPLSTCSCPSVDSY